MHSYSYLTVILTPFLMSDASLMESYLTSLANEKLSQNFSYMRTSYP